MTIIHKSPTLLSVEMFTNHVTCHHYEKAAEVFSTMTPMAKDVAIETYKGLRAICPSLGLPKSIPGVQI